MTIVPILFYAAIFILIAAGLIYKYKNQDIVIEVKRMPRKSWFSLTNFWKSREIYQRENNYKFPVEERPALWKKGFVVMFALVLVFIPFYEFIPAIALSEYSIFPGCILAGG